MANIGFIGLGIMGTPMAINLKKGDHQLFLFSRSGVKEKALLEVGEALLFASKAGADPARVRQALMGGFASSRILELHGERLLKRNFTPGFRIELHQKDLGLALEGARALGLSLPNTATCQELFNSCIANGLAKSDHAAMVSALELLANHSIAHESANS
jgi:2-hydroxy-3-oxopropionate reductase